jgi:hypothetical protein
MISNGRLIPVKAQRVAGFLSYRLGASHVEAVLAIAEPESGGVNGQPRRGAYTIGWGFVWYRSQWYRLLDLRTWFKPGDGITLQYVTDCYPATVERVTRTRVIAREDNWTRLDDRGLFTEQQEYSYSPNPDGREIVGTLRKNGAVKLTGARTRSGGCTISYGRRYYRDPHV